MSVQIAVRLPEDLVAHVDDLVAQGAASRAAVVVTALERLRAQQRAEQDARILEATGDYDDFEGLDTLATHVDPDA